MKFTRRQFLTTSLAAGGVAVLGRYLQANDHYDIHTISGSILGASSQWGHLLRDGKIQQSAPVRHEQTDIVIVGGGIAGLSAAYTLNKRGQHDFRLLELEQQVGGNSNSGKNAVSAYPWGAHYVPLLSSEATVARQLFEDFGVITGYDSATKLPIYNEFYLCHDPHERLFFRGHWQEDLVPTVGMTAESEQQIQQFLQRMHHYQTLRGRDGKKVFAIPVDKSSQDAEWLALDQLTMQAWMAQQGWVAEELCWYVNYCCRDDYGTTFQETSAWAGIHYFTARASQAANAEVGTVLTWPQGNGWLSEQLAKPVQDKLNTRALVHKLQTDAQGVQLIYWDTQHNENVSIRARAVILAVPEFVAARLLSRPMQSEISYAPWAVANITLNTLPEAKNGMPLAWDNVAYRSEMLGYVVATHQATEMVPQQTVLTYYWPLSHLPPAQARQQALAKAYADWRYDFATELLRLHPDLVGKMTNIDIWLWGHAMVRPTVGFIWGQARQQMCQQQPPIFRAHSDMSGISIFEEACTRGVNAAEQVLAWLKE